MSTSPISIYNTHISGYNHIAGMATYTGPTPEANLTVYAAPLGLEAGQTYAITGLILGTAIPVEFQSCKYLGPMAGAPAIATFKADAWEKV